MENRGRRLTRISGSGKLLNVVLTGLFDVSNQLAKRGYAVIIAGLDHDYTGKPWEPMPQLLAIAEYITKTHAICMKCGQPANYFTTTFESE